ncbi:hypothetical protein T02_6501 [Trichinella nativa]|uniref:Uncharacterized protein n=1 Tax=Trichinella nativa TaxID=6335 RepID=A0A0V1KJG8_9BILA|nr:hypothetical protein T02_6501 [Trichinella nativa]
MLLRDVTNGQYAVNIQLVIRFVHLDMMDFFPPSKVRISKHQVDTRSDKDERKLAQQQRQSRKMKMGIQLEDKAST